MEKRLEGTAGEGVTDVQPGEAEVIELAPEVLEPSPKKWRQERAGQGTKSRPGKLHEEQEQGDPEADYQPQRNGTRTEDEEKAKQLGSSRRQANNEPEVKG